MKWICDKCHGLIETPREGFVQWKEKGRIRIVHASKCLEIGGEVSDHHLETFLGEDGLLYLLDVRRRYDLSVDEIDEAIKRLHVADYDLVRGRIGDAVEAEVIELNTYPEYPTVGQIRDIREWLEERGEFPS